MGRKSIGANGETLTHDLECCQGIKTLVVTRGTPQGTGHSARLELVSEGAGARLGQRRLCLLRGLPEDLLQVAEPLCCQSRLLLLLVPFQLLTPKSWG